jgi:alanine dehydrogenase
VIPDVIVDEEQVRELLKMNEAVEVVEKAFKLYALGECVMPPKLYLDLPQFNGDFRAMPAYIDGIAGMKWVSVYPKNSDYGLPTVIATIILSDSNTSVPLALVDGTYLTSARTGAAGGVAAKYLARKDASVMGLIGAGAQARTQLLATKYAVPGIKKVNVYDPNLTTAQTFASDMSAQLDLGVVVVDSIEEAAQSDIVVTTTPSRSPVLLKRHVRPGTHINAIGADAEGKQEIESELMQSSKIVVDDMAQACHSGEVNVPLSCGAIREADIYCSLGEVVAGMKRGRVSDDEITIFDSTGLAIQDLVCAKLVYEKAKAACVV